MRHSFLVMALALLSGAAQAATVFKCVDAQGKVSFTANANCPVNHDLNDVVSVDNATIGRSGERAVMAPSTKYNVYINQVIQRNTQRARAAARATSTAPCSTGLNDQDLRTAKVRGEIVPGMTRKDIQNAYGSSSDNVATGGGSSTYASDRFRKVVRVSYDRHGCVNGSNQYQYKP